MYNCKKLVLQAHTDSARNKLTSGIVPFSCVHLKSHNGKKKSHIIIHSKYISFVRLDD